MKNCKTNTEALKAELQRLWLHHLQMRNKTLVELQKQTEVLSKKISDVCAQQNELHNYFQRWDCGKTGFNTWLSERGTFLLFSNGNEYTHYVSDTATLRLYLIFLMMTILSIVVMLKA